MQSREALLFITRCKDAHVRVKPTLIRWHEAEGICVDREEFWMFACLLYGNGKEINRGNNMEESRNRAAFQESRALQNHFLHQVLRQGAKKYHVKFVLFDHLGASKTSYAFKFSIIFSFSMAKLPTASSLMKA